MALARHRADSTLIMRHCGPNGSSQPHTTSSWTGHRRELDYFRVGCELEANRNFLYEWWPIVRRRNLYQRLSAAQVELRPYTIDYQTQQTYRNSEDPHAAQ